MCPALAWVMGTMRKVWLGLLGEMLRQPSPLSEKLWGWTPVQAPCRGSRACEGPEAAVSAVLREQ